MTTECGNTFGIFFTLFICLNLVLAIYIKHTLLTQESFKSIPKIGSVEMVFLLKSVKKKRLIISYEITKNKRLSLVSETLFIWIKKYC